MQRNKAENAIIKVLGHSERKEILHILETSPEGVKYSSILGETGLTTSKLNYQLKEMKGFIKKDDDRLYHLTTLGHKAISVLNHLNENLDEEAIELTLSVENQRRSFLKRHLNKLFYVIMGLFGIGLIVLTYFSFAEPGGGITLPILALSYAVCGGIIYGFDKARRGSPKYLISFVDWLEWKFFNGKGAGNFMGRKMFVLTVLGFILGALLGKAGLGLILGLFLGAAMEM
jgi:predicted transcriptional regulator/preprotein translocase subunit SecG